jgi:hypothetical protein
MWAEDSVGHREPAFFGLSFDQGGYLEPENGIAGELSGEQPSVIGLPRKPERNRLLGAEMVLEQERRPHPPKGNGSLLLLRVDHVLGLGARKPPRPSGELHSGDSTMRP